MKLDEFLSSRDVPFEKMPHRPAYTANRIARLLHVPGKEVAKTVLVRVDDQFALVVLPATHQVDLERVRRELGGKRVEMADEKDMARLFPDCEPGAIPPFGSLYHITTLVDQTLTEDEKIVFEANTHHNAIRMAYRDFQEQEHPRIGHFASSSLEDMVNRCTEKLVKRVRKQLPDHLKKRLDPEDIVQSVYRNFSRMIKQGTYVFEDSRHIWRLLTVMTYHEVRDAVRFHEDSSRDVRREDQGEARPFLDSLPGPEEVVSFLDSIEHRLKDWPEQHRMIVRLFLHGETITAIAGQAGCSPSTVRRVLDAAQERMRSGEPVV